MVSPIAVLSTLDKPEHIETWIRCFTALARVKKLRDEKTRGGDNESQTYFWLQQAMKL